jgi:hypothetical protein
VVYWVQTFAWRVVEKKERGWERILARSWHAWHRLSSSPSFLSIFEHGRGWVMLGVVLVNFAGHGC